jgi:NitT/TauT family transport system ATP-binding protein
VRDRLARPARLGTELVVHQCRESRPGMAPWCARPTRDVIAGRIVLTVEDLHHAYAPDQVVSASISFEIKTGEFVSIVGPSGCGKTTLLKALSGLLDPTGGTIKFQGVRVRGVPDGLAMVFQEYGRSLLPWRTVNGNIELPLRYQPLTSEERRRRVGESLQAVGLAGFGERYPWQLSGGMQQRVAIARALAYRPKLLLMDEPFASVDAQTRADLEDLVAEVRDRFGITIVLVTHDIDESVYLSDRVIVLSRSPSKVLAQIDIGLSRPRDQIGTKATPQFVEKRSVIAQLILRPSSS